MYVIKNHEDLSTVCWLQRNHQQAFEDSTKLKHMSDDPYLLYLPSFRPPGCWKTNLVLGCIYMGF